MRPELRVRRAAGQAAAFTTWLDALARVLAEPDARVVSAIAIGFVCDDGQWVIDLATRSITGGIGSSVVDGWQGLSLVVHGSLTSLGALVASLSAPLTTSSVRFEGDGRALGELSALIATPGPAA